MEDHFIGLHARQTSLQQVFLWRHGKTIVHATKPSYLKAKITNVISGITINQLANDFRELQNRITVCIVMEDV